MDISFCLFIIYYLTNKLCQNTKRNTPAYSGGDKPFNAAYGKLMMWFFLITDALTFSGFLEHTDGEI